MQECIDFLLDLFKSVFGILQSLSFELFGYHVSYFWLLVSLMFMGFLFTVLIPFVARSSHQYQKSTSERNDK